MDTRKVRNYRLTYQRGVDWTQYRTQNGFSAFHAAEQTTEYACDFELSIDIDGLIRHLARSAALSKGKRSRLASGLIQLRCTDRKVLSDSRTEKEIPAGYLKIEKAA